MVANARTLPVDSDNFPNPETNMFCTYSGLRVKGADFGRGNLNFTCVRRVVVGFKGRVIGLRLLSSKQSVETENVTYSKPFSRTLTRT